MNTYIKFFGMILLSLLISGCMYPESELEKNQVPSEAQLEMVQSAVERYKEDTNGLVPIRTKPNETPIFEKYLIDFSILTDRGLLSELPGNSFENGGIYQYALITPDNNPRVRLIDLQITEEIRSINMKLKFYREEHLYPPFGEKIDEDLYTVDYEKLKLDSPPTVKSPYSDEFLPIIMDVDGNIYVDYRIDLNHALKEYSHDYAEGDDIRFILAENTPILPAYSYKYTVKDGEPVFLHDK